MLVFLMVSIAFGYFIYNLFLFDYKFKYFFWFYSLVESLPVENNVCLQAENNMSLPAENNVILPPSMNARTFFSPELDAGTSAPNNLWSSVEDQSQNDMVGNHSSEIYRNYYSEQFAAWNEGTVYYEQVNYGLYQFSNDMSFQEGDNETLQVI